MRITQLNLPASAHGFAPFQLSTDKRVNVFIGPNGSGKTRLLHMIHDWKAITSSMGLKFHPELAVTQHFLRKPRFFGPKDLVLHGLVHDPDSAGKVAADYLQTFLNPDPYFDNELLLAMATLKAQDKEDLVTEFGKTAQALTGKPFTFNRDGISAELGGRNLETGQPSEGQIRLLKYAAGLHRLDLRVAAAAGSGDVVPQILLLDEPEANLQPKTAVRLLSMLLREARASAVSQVWIGTHSIALCAFLTHVVEASEINFFAIGEVNEHGLNTVSYTGPSLVKVLDDMLPSEPFVCRLREILDPRLRSLVSFATECLLQPEVVAASGKPDKQGTISLSKLPDAAVILEFGAGSGRLLDAMHAESVRLERPFSYQYHACDHPGSGESSIEENARRREECLTVIGKVYTGMEAETLASRHIQWDASSAELLPWQEHSFDVIILSNVLHEIPVSTWLGLFQKFCKLLKPDGVLHLSEVYPLIAGETCVPEAHFDFLLLNFDQLRVLCGENELTCLTDPRDSRIHLALLSPADLLQITSETIHAAMLAVYEDSQSKIRDRHKSAPHPSRKKAQEAGHWHAFHLCQSVNAQTVLEDQFGWKFQQQT